MVNHGTSKELNIQIDLEKQGPVAGQASRNNSEKTLASADEEQPPKTVNIPIEAPPDSGYGWVCVVCCFWINAHTWGINSVRSDIRRTRGESS